MRTKLKKYDKTYKELTAENAELEKERNSASRESIQKKLEIQRKLSELDELRRTVDSIPDAVIREYTEQKKQAVIEQLWLTYYNDTLFCKRDDYGRSAQ